GDMAAIKAIVDRINSGFVANFVRAYFTKTLTKPKRNNRKGAAGAYIVENVNRGWVEACLRILPGFLSEDDLQAVRSIVDETSSGFVADALKDYFQ
ncbi:hypothetical protein HOF92_05130, partial [bacterium]|nr:hypothetical protein [bacterium]